ncbi:MAG: response regulator [Planctomycetes bacterium]|nr:response regulator [Planctomycetota bacterium]MBU4399343.1 response regulator [Planctomycetota bacterium]MCG2683253.1 response regulator [Planctomycetales bacterium]
MSNVLRLAIVDPNDSQREALKSMLLGMDLIWLEAECSRYEFFADVVAQTNPDIGLVSIDADPQKALELVGRLGAASPDCAVLVVSSSNDGSLILQALRAGAKEYLTHPVRIEDLLAALGRIGERRAGRGENRPRGNQVIAVAGAIGGVGTTSLAVNLGCILAKNPRNSVALVDLDLCLGDADVFLDTIPDYTLVDVAQNVTRLDFTLLKRSLTKHSSGLYLLPRPVQLEDVALITPDDLQRVIGLLKATFTHLVLDLSKGYTAIDMIALEMAGQILLTTQLDLPCLRNVVRLMMSFGNMDDLADKVKIVVNRVGLDSGQITLKKAEETIGKEIFWQLPNDYRTMIEARNNGVPLIDSAPKAAVTQSLMALAKALDGDEDAKSEASAGKKGIGGLLKLWSGKNGK